MTTWVSDGNAILALSFNTSGKRQGCEMTFGKGGGGRRNSTRRAAGVTAQVQTTFTSRSVDLLDVSLTGAKLGGLGLPDIGQDVLVTFEKSEAFGKVVWSEPDSCGVEFDGPITEQELAAVQEETKKAKLMKLTPAEKQALDNWGFAKSL